MVSSGGAFLNDGDTVQVVSPATTGKLTCCQRHGNRQVMNVSAWSIRNPVPALLLFALLTFLGLQGFKALGIQNFPDIDLPTVVVTATLEGADPEQLESEVARKIENQLATLTGVKHIRTTLTDSTASIATEFDIDTNTETAPNDVRNAVDSIRASLPAAMNDPVVSKITTV